MFLENNITSKYLWKISQKHDISKYHLKLIKYQHFDLPGLTQGSPQTSKMTPRAPWDAPRTFAGPPRIPKDLPRDTQRTLRFPQGPPKDPQGPPPKHAHSTSLIPQNLSRHSEHVSHHPNLSSPKKLMRLKKCPHSKHLWFLWYEH